MSRKIMTFSQCVRRMREERYRRSRLCGLCEGPIVDGGVLVYQKRYTDRLRRWWKAHLDTEFTKQSCTVCFFCAWDLRFADENSESKEPLDQRWWPKVKKSNSSQYYPYYCEELMKSCSVKILPLNEKFAEASRKKLKGVAPVHQCIYCQKRFGSYQHMSVHSRSFHPEIEIRCKFATCRKFFLTQEEKIEHLKEQHHSESSIKCFYCGIVSTNEKQHSNHLQWKHKGQVHKCQSVGCKIYFKTKKEKDEHFEEKHNFGKFFCCFCTRYIDDANKYRLHMRTKHKEALKCNTVKNCPNYFKTEKDRQKHVQEKHPRAKVLECIYCGKAYYFRSSILKHIKKEHQDVAIRCEIDKKCATYFKTEEEKLKHQKEIHNKNSFFCFYCDKTICYKGGFKIHLFTTHSKEEIIRCNYNYCLTYFKSEEEKSAHTKQVHERSDVGECCIYCNKFVIKKQGNLQRHVIARHSDVSIKCTYPCTTYFKTVEERDNHVKEVHLVVKTKEPFQCPYCDNIYPTLGHCSTHIKSKHLDVAIKCQFNLCGKYFKSKEDLDIHLKQKPEHKENIRPFLCPLCPNNFRTKKDLDAHTKNMHVKNKQYCPHCKKPRSNVKNHIKRVFCQICKLKFMCPGLLRNHNVQCKPNLKCPVCTKILINSFGLKQHLKNVHTVRIQQWKRLQYKSLGFKCDECFVYFPTKKHMQYHVRENHSLCKSICHFCKRKFAQRLYLKKHIVEKHL